MDEQRTCGKCGESFYGLHTWLEIDPRTNKTVYMCDGCYVARDAVHESVIMRVYIPERYTALEMLWLCGERVYAYRVTYHMFDNHVQNEPDYNNYTLSWIRDAFRKMNHMYDDLCVNATETYMDCDTCSQ